MFKKVPLKPCYYLDYIISIGHCQYSFFGKNALLVELEIISYFEFFNCVRDFFSIIYNHLKPNMFFSLIKQTNFPEKILYFFEGLTFHISYHNF